MPKINQEEYEALRTLKKTGFTEIIRSRELRYSIADLIEEYEEHEFYDYVGWKYYKKGKAEVKKDIDWLKREIHKELETWHGVEGGIDGDGINEIMLLINQHEESEVKRLDRKMKELESYNDELVRDNNQLRDAMENQEVLSQDWITENSVEGDFRGVQEFWYGEFIEKEKVQNLLVPKQELPVIPQFVADWITAMHNGGLDLYPALKRLESNALIWEDVFKWYRENTCSFVNAYLTREYKVGEEQKYRVSLHDGTWLVSDDNKNISKATTYFMHQEDGGFMNRMHEFTEQQINDVDTRYMTFAVKVEELEE